MSSNILVLGAHPDDADLGVGGIIAKLAAGGYSVIMADLTAGEMSSRGTVDERKLEAQEAGKILGVTERVCLGLPDSKLDNNEGQRLEIVACIRRYTPKYILAPMTPDRHPDHCAAHVLVRDAHFLSGLHKLEMDAPPHRADRIFYYHAYYESMTTPTMVVNVSETYERKIAALRAYVSQLYHPGYAGVETHVSSKAFWDDIEVRARFWGRRIGVEFGEPLYTELPLGVNLPWESGLQE